jgi:hypothetical protein
LDPKIILDIFEKKMQSKDRTTPVKIKYEDVDRLENISFELIRVISFWTTLFCIKIDQ